MMETLREILDEPQPNTTTPPEAFSRVFQQLMDRSEGVNDTPERDGALNLLNAALAIEFRKLHPFHNENPSCAVRARSSSGESPLSSWFSPVNHAAR